MFEIIFFLNYNNYISKKKIYKDYFNISNTEIILKTHFSKKNWNFNKKISFLKNKKIKKNDELANEMQINLGTYESKTPSI